MTRFESTATTSTKVQSASAAAAASSTSGPLTIQTERFGALTLLPTEQVQFTSPILGFETETRFTLFNDPEDPESPFQWLQSLATPDLAFIVTNPIWFGLEYALTLPDTIVSALQIQDPQAVQIVTLVTVPAEAPETMTTNLMAPIVINIANQTALQWVMHDAPAAYGLRVRLIPDEAMAGSSTVLAEG